MAYTITADEIREAFSQAMSAMYQQEVPQYGTLLELVADVNLAVLENNPKLHEQLANADELARLNVERHGAIRVGTPLELSTLRRLFAVMGMQPVGYYDLSEAGVPVHSTAFRPVDDEALCRNPFRVFTSLLRPELIESESLRQRAKAILAKRSIFTPRCLELLDCFEQQGGFTAAQASEFVQQALETLVISRPGLLVTPQTSSWPTRWGAAWVPLEVIQGALKSFLEQGRQDPLCGARSREWGGPGELEPKGPLRVSSGGQLGMAHSCLYDKRV